MSPLGIVSPFGIWSSGSLELSDLRLPLIGTALVLAVLNMVTENHQMSLERVNNTEIQGNQGSI